MLNSIQSSRLGLSNTVASVTTSPLPSEALVKLTPAPLKTFEGPESVFISEEARSKVENDAETLKFVRKIQADVQASPTHDRFLELKSQLQSPEGLNQYFASLDNNAIANTLLEEKLV
jgi:hypothetical protein